MLVLELAIIVFLRTEGAYYFLFVGTYTSIYIPLLISLYIKNSSIAKSFLGSSAVLGVRGSVIYVVQQQSHCGVWLAHRFFF